MGGFQIVPLLLFAVVAWANVFVFRKAVSALRRGKRSGRREGSVRLLAALVFAQQGLCVLLLMLGAVTGHDASQLAAGLLSYTALATYFFAVVVAWVVDGFTARQKRTSTAI